MTGRLATVWPPVRSVKVDEEAILSTFPTWIRPYVPAQPPHQIRVVWSVETGFACWFSDTGKFSSLPTFGEACGVAQKFPQSKYEWVMDRSVLLSPEANGENPALTEGFGSEDQLDYMSTVNMRRASGGLSMIFAKPWDRSVDGIREGFYNSHRAIRQWLDNQDSPVTAFRLVQTHPMFWTFQPAKGGEPGGWWNTENGIDLVTTDIYMSFESDENPVPKPVVRLETGPHDDQRDYAQYQRYLHLEMTAHGDTYEQALCLLAKHVYQYYNCCGEERPREKNKAKLPDPDAGNIDADCYYHSTEPPSGYDED